MNFPELFSIALTLQFAGALLLPLCAQEAHNLGGPQLVIENPKHLSVPEERARVLLSTSQRVVEERFHLRPSRASKFQLRLVLGQENERYIEDDQTGIPTIYVVEWNEGKFALSALRLAVWRVLDKNDEIHIVREIVRRAERIAPISVNTLQRVADPPMVDPGGDLGIFNRTCPSSAGRHVCLP